ncbi:hypothetical protein [Streptomyces pseudogriseolus]|uniref:hypothetical protein n=1 Tax=Streptomyces pseudogriseolus TaxID=36817 RepID=UPI0036D1A1C7
MTNRPAWFTAAQQRAEAEAPNVPEPTIHPVEYVVSCLQSNNINFDLYAIRVQYRGDGRYAVIGLGDMCLGVDGTWDHGVKEYDRGDDWLDAHRFDLETALRLAKEQAPLVTVNGRTVSDALGLTGRRSASA